MKNLIKSFWLCFAIFFVGLAKSLKRIKCDKQSQRTVEFLMRYSPMPWAKESKIIRDSVSNLVVSRLKFKKIEGSAVKNIVLVYDVIKSGPYYSHDDSIIGHAIALANNKSVNSVSIVVTHESAMFGSKFFNENKGPSTLDAVKKKLEHLCHEKKFKISLRYFFCKGLDDVYCVCEHILKKNPDVIVFNSGLDNESRLFRSIFFNRVPIARTMVQSDMVPDYEVDLLLAKIADNKFSELCRSKNVKFKFLIYPKSDLVKFRSPKKFSRGGRKVLVTALTGNRIQKVIKGYSKSDLHTLLEIISCKEDDVWMLIGSQLAEDLKGVDLELDLLVDKGKIIFGEPTRNLKSIIRDADLYVNIPGITGGGGTGVMARNVGTPVITDGYSDVANKQPRSFITNSGDMEGFVKNANLLLNDEGAINAFFNEYNEILDNMASHEYEFYMALVEAKENFMDKH